MTSPAGVVPHVDTTARCVRRQGLVAASPPRIVSQTRKLPLLAAATLMVWLVAQVR